MSTVVQQTSSSTSPTKATNIQIRRVQLTDPTQIPSSLSTTPGGTLFSTTPGGTRIVYDRSFLLECRNSPLAKSPPVGLPPIPGVTCVALSPNQVKNGAIPHHPQQRASFGHPPTSPIGVAQKSPGLMEEPQFEMDM